MYLLKKIVFLLSPIFLVLSIRLANAYQRGIFGQDTSISAIDNSLNIFKASVSNTGWAIWVLGFWGLALSIWNKNQKYLSLTKWMLTLLLLSLLQSISGITISRFANTLIFLSLPLTLFAGYIFKYLFFRTKRTGIEFIYGFLFLVSLIGAYNATSIITPSTILYSKSDEKAMEWVTKNTSPNSVFLMNSFLWGENRVSSDGGAWIITITNRKTILYNPINFENLLDNEQIDYIYVGRGYGDINPDDLLIDHRFSLIYYEDNIRIFRVNGNK